VIDRIRDPQEDQEDGDATNLTGHYLDRVGVGTIEWKPIEHKSKNESVEFSQYDIFSKTPTQ